MSKFHHYFFHRKRDTLQTSERCFNVNYEYCSLLLLDSLPFGSYNYNGIIMQRKWQNDGKV